MSISYRETWKMERKSLVAIQRKSSNEKAQNVSENMDYIVLSGTKSRDFPTFNDCEVLIIPDYRNVPVVYTKTGR